LRRPNSKVHKAVMFDWNDLRHFLAVARNGSTVAAAKAMGLSQSTVHRRLAELQKRMGRHLFIRHSTGYRLTESGKEIVPLAQQVEAAALAIERHLAASDDAPTGTVRITCSESIGYRLMRSTLLDTFEARYPELKVELLMSDRYFDLSKGEADIAIRAGEAHDDSLIGRKIADVPWALYGSRYYVQRHGTIRDIGEIANHLVVGFDGDMKRHAAAQWLQNVAPSAKIVARSTSVPGLMMTVKSGAGVAPLPSAMAGQDPDLVRMLGPIPAITSYIYLLSHPDLRQMPRVRAVFNFFAAELDAVRKMLVGNSG
jgi:DNA-binding transcriptional LysR family regulator